MITRVKKNELEILRQGGKILMAITAELCHLVRPGLKTKKLEEKFLQLTQEAGAEPAFLGYRNYPHAICVSINEELVHTPPGERIIKEGDIVSIDCGLKFKGWCTDISRTIAVGNVSAQTHKLLAVTRQALDYGIEQALAGNKIGDISATIQKFVESQDFSVVRKLVGHGIGREVHEDPPIPNFGKADTGLTLEEGMVLALEPMVNMGSPEVIFNEQEWTVRTKDGKLCAHFEDTIVVTKSMPIILTR